MSEALSREYRRVPLQALDFNQTNATNQRSACRRLQCDASPSVKLPTLRTPMHHSPLPLPRVDMAIAPPPFEQIEETSAQITELAAKVDELLQRFERSRVAVGCSSSCLSNEKVDVRVEANGGVRRGSNSPFVHGASSSTPGALACARILQVASALPLGERPRPLPFVV